jgi:hypothetical protein
MKGAIEMGVNRIKKRLIRDIRLIRGISFNKVNKVNKEVRSIQATLAWVALIWISIGAVSGGFAQDTSLACDSAAYLAGLEEIDEIRKLPGELIVTTFELLPAGLQPGPTAWDEAVLRITSLSLDMCLSQFELCSVIFSGLFRTDGAELGASNEIHTPDSVGFCGVSITRGFVSRSFPESVRRGLRASLLNSSPVFLGPVEPPKDLGPLGAPLDLRGFEAGISLAAYIACERDRQSQQDWQKKKEMQPDQGATLFSECFVTSGRWVPVGEIDKVTQNRPQGFVVPIVVIPKQLQIDHQRDNRSHDI